jgi:hypothetical protein
MKANAGKLCQHHFSTRVTRLLLNVHVFVISDAANPLLMWLLYVCVCVYENKLPVSFVCASVKRINVVLLHSARMKNVPLPGMLSLWFFPLKFETKVCIVQSL